MKKFLVITFLSFVILSCNSNKQKFNPHLWAPYETGVIGEGRKKMLFDLTRHVLIPDITTKKEIDSLLGENNSIDHSDASLVYDVHEKYGWNIDPEGYIKLKLYFTKDSILQQWKIEDTTFNP